MPPASFVDRVMAMDQPGHAPLVRPSQGVHLVLDKRFLQSDYAIMVPKTSDGRVLFAVPWHDKVVVGTTDILRETPEEEPRPLEEEIDFILRHGGPLHGSGPDASRYSVDVAGQRPLAGTQ